MLAAIGRFLQGPPLPIIAVLVALPSLALVIPGLLLGFLLASVAAAFLILVRPLPLAAQILIASAAINGVIAALINGTLWALLPPALYFGIPAALALLLRRSNSLSLTILTGFLGAWIGALILGGLPLGVDHYVAGTLESLRDIAQSGGRPDPFPGPLGEMLALLGTEMIMASSMLLFTFLLLLARGLQSYVADTPFFRVEFRALRYGHTMAIAFLLAGFMAWWQSDVPLWLGLMLTFMLVFLFSGIALVHRLSDGIRFPLAILAPFYMLLLIVQETVLIVATVSAADDLLGLSRRLTRNSGSA